VWWRGEKKGGEKKEGSTKKKEGGGRVSVRGSIPIAKERGRGGASEKKEKSGPLFSFEKEEKEHAVFLSLFPVEKEREKGPKERGEKKNGRLTPQKKGKEGQQ